MISRRKILKTVPATAAIAVAGSSLSAKAQTIPVRFDHGVASGDPLQDRIIIWTRVNPDDQSFSGDVEVEWQMSRDADFADIVKSGKTITNRDRDFTIKEDVVGLQENHNYFYRFKVGDVFSSVGETKTLGARDVSEINLAVVSCSNYPWGYFNGYRSIAESGPFDAVLHLGDYIYEYEIGVYQSENAEKMGRLVDPPHEIKSLDDYRRRYALYRSDEDLQEVHRKFPFICCWDDHEFANNAWTGGANNHNPGEGEWSDRKNNGWQAYFEWMPVRDLGDNIIRRTIDWGDLAKLYMLDTRIEGRDEQVAVGSDEIMSTSRTLLGQDQKDWLLDEMVNSTAQWNLFGQQVMMAPVTVFGLEVNTDQWDGYQGDRNWFYSVLQGFEISNPVILTGDIHTSWANNLPLSDYNENTQTGSVGVEYVVTSITSQGSPIDMGVSLIQILNPHVQYVDLTAHGYVMLDVTESRVQGDYYYVENLNEPDWGQYVGASYAVDDGDHFLYNAANPSFALDNLAPFPPLCPFAEGANNIKPLSSEVSILGVYPNPTTDKAVMQYSLFKSGDVTYNLYGLDGSLVTHMTQGNLPRGLHYISLDLSGLVPAVYILELQVKTEGGFSSSKVRLVKR